VRLSIAALAVLVTLLFEPTYAAAQTVVAAPPVLGAVQELGPGVHDIVADATPSGELSLTWMRMSAAGGHELVTTSRRSTDPLFPAPSVLVAVPDYFYDLHGARNPRGDQAVVWRGSSESSHGSRVWLVVRSAAFPGTTPAVEALPPPPPIPEPDAGESSSSPPGFSATAVAVAMTADGAAIVAACDSSSTERLVIWVRQPDGAIDAPTVSPGCSAVSAAADGYGTALVLAHGPRDDPSSNTLEDARVFERVPGARSVGPPRILSVPHEDTNNGGAGITGIVMSTTGHAMAFWSGGRSGGGPSFGTTVAYSTRDAGGDWIPRQLVFTGTNVRAAGGITAAGDAALMWSPGLTVGGIFRRGLGAFSPPSESAPMTPPNGGPYPMAMDAFGTAVLVRPAFESGLNAALRFRGGAYSDEIAVQAPGSGGVAPAIAMDGLGNGVFAWRLHRGSFNAGDVVTRPYSLLPPMPTDVTAGPSRTVLRFSVNEPARIAIQAQAGSRTAKQTAVVPIGRNRIPLAPTLRALLARRGARLTLRTRDAGPSVLSTRVRLARP